MIAFSYQGEHRRTMKILMLWLLLQKRSIMAFRSRTKQTKKFIYRICQTSLIFLSFFRKPKKIRTLHFQQTEIQFFGNKTLYTFRSTMSIANCDMILRREKWDEIKLKFFLLFYQACMEKNTYLYYYHIAINIFPLDDDKKYFFCFFASSIALWDEGRVAKKYDKKLLDG
jgi:hypothetical protein